MIIAMALSKDAKSAYKKALKAKKKKNKKNWFFIRKGDSAKEVASKLFTQFAALVLVGCIVILGNELRMSLGAKFLNDSLKDLYYTYIYNSGGTDEILPSAGALLEINEDAVGWVHIEGTNVSLPVVQRASADGNEYYLKKAFDGSNNKAGTVFLDRRAKLTARERSDNLVIYGHNQKDKTMFGDLLNYKNNTSYYELHPTISFSSNYRTDIYKIFAYFVAPVLESQTRDGVVFDYHNYIDFQNKAAVERFVGNIISRSQIVTDVDLKYGDEFLTLSTCSTEFDQSRFVVFARKVREGEDETVDVSKAYMNTQAIEPDYNFIFGR